MCFMIISYPYLGPVPGKYMQTPPLSFAPICMKHAHSAESKEKSIFRFLFFELWLIVFTFFFVFLSLFCATFSLWDMVDFDVCDFMYAKDFRDFCEPDSDANQWG